MTEKQLRAAVARYLDSVPGLVWWPVVPGRSGAAGVPDISALISGRFLAIELKRPDGGVVSPLQRAWHERIRAAGGVVIVARTVDDCRDAINSIIFNTNTLDK